MAAALDVSALTIPLDHRRVPTSIEGVRVDLFVSGTAIVEFSDGSVMVRIDATIDLSDVQKRFASIARARAVKSRCGDSMSLEDARVQPAQRGAETVAEVVSTATIRRTRCSEDGASVVDSTVTTGRLAIDLTPHVGDHEQLLFDLAMLDTTSAAVAALAADPSVKEKITSMIAGSLSSAVGPSTIAAPLSADAASYDPRVKAVEFKSLAEGALAAHLVVTLRVPLAKFFDWKLGGEQ